MPRILIIEDQPQMRESLALMLDFEGYDVVTAVNGRSGLDIALSAPPDVILCDVMMPELDGYSVLRALGEHPATAAVPFIFLTAKGDKAEIETGLNSGADGYLTKPVSRAELLAALRAHGAASPSGS